MATAYDNRSEEEIQAAQNQWDNTTLSDEQAQLQRNNEALLRQLNPGDPKYRGPGWIQGPTGDNGGVTLIRSSDPAAIQAQNEWEIANTNPEPTRPDVGDIPPPVGSTGTGKQEPKPLPVNGYQEQPNVFSGGTPVATSPTNMDPGIKMDPGIGDNDYLKSLGVDTGYEAPTIEDGPAEADRTKIDALLDQLSRATSGLYGLAENKDKYSAAQAQLAQGTAAAQQNALALARSGNRRDAAALGARALQTNAELGGEATRSAAALRAQEEDANNRLRLDAYKAAGDLGLNTAALELDVSKMNMDAATQYLNNLFEDRRIDKQISQAEAERITNFVRDMALIDKDYYALSMQERQSLRDDLTRRYGIDEQTAVALKQIEESGTSWTEFGQQLALGAVSGGASLGAAAIMKPSDRRTKDNIKDTTDEDLENLLSAVKSQTFDYKGNKYGKPGNLGVMAQDLEKSKYGKAMVEEDADGVKRVDSGKAGLAALSGLALVYEKLKQLENSL